MPAGEAPNKFGVEATGPCVELHCPPRGPFCARDAYLLAAYLVSVADGVADPAQDGTFGSWLEAVQGTPRKNAA